MLLDLKVLNGIMTPDFSSDVFDYTIEVKDVNTLDLSFVVDKNLPVTIYGNDFLTDGENHVLLEIFDEKLNTYTLTVYKNSEQEASKISNNSSKVEIDSKSLLLEDVLTPGVISVCFILIIVLYSIIFHKK